MKILSTIILIAVISCPLCHADTNKVQSVNIETLRSGEVLGKIGVPFGKVVQIEAIIIDGDASNVKGNQGRFLLKVIEVEGDPLNEPVFMHFGSRVFHDVKLTNNHFGLYELKYGKKAEELDSEQMEELKKGYVGKIVKLMVYESGRFGGIPKNFPSDVLRWQDTGFGFKSHLNVIKMLDNK